MCWHWKPIQGASIKICICTPQNIFRRKWTSIVRNQIGSHNIRRAECFWHDEKNSIPITNFLSTAVLHFSAQGFEGVAFSVFSGFYSRFHISIGFWRACSLSSGLFNRVRFYINTWFWRAGFLSCSGFCSSLLAFSFDMRAELKRNTSSLCSCLL